ncbi:MAG: type II secretion system F family protein [Clostridia bacterium]|nr:type II secretion system F family protein [Clostridia bacterium]
MTPTILGALAGLAAGAGALWVGIAFRPVAAPARRPWQLSLPVLVRWTVGRRSTKEAVALAAGLDEVLLDVADAMRAGRSFVQALAEAAASARPPWRERLQEVLHRYGQGVPLAQALDPVRRIGRHGSLWVDAVDLCRSTGGNLPTVLARLAELTREDRLVVDEFRARTAEARLTARLLGLLPPVLIIAMTAAEPETVESLWQDPAGRVAALYALASWGTGWWLLKRLTRFGTGGWAASTRPFSRQWRGWRH